MPLTLAGWLDNNSPWGRLTIRQPFFSSSFYMCPFFYTEAGPAINAINMLGGHGLANGTPDPLPTKHGAEGEGKESSQLPRPSACQPGHPSCLLAWQAPQPALPGMAGSPRGQRRMAEGQGRGNCPPKVWGTLGLKGSKYTVLSMLLSWERRSAQRTKRCAGRARNAVIPTEQCMAAAINNLPQGVSQGGHFAASQSPHPPQDTQASATEGMP